MNRQILLHNSLSYESLTYEFKINIYQYNIVSSCLSNISSLAGECTPGSSIMRRRGCGSTRRHRCWWWCWPWSMIDLFLFCPSLEWRLPASRLCLWPHPLTGLCSVQLFAGNGRSSRSNKGSTQMELPQWLMCSINCTTSINCCINLALGMWHVIKPLKVTRNGKGTIQFRISQNLTYKN